MTSESYLWCPFDKSRPLPFSCPGVPDRVPHKKFSQGRTCSKPSRPACHWLDSNVAQCRGIEIPYRIFLHLQVPFYYLMSKNLSQTDQQWCASPAVMDTSMVLINDKTVVFQIYHMIGMPFQYIQRKMDIFCP